MIGTGTIDDPFIPTTLDEFRTAVSTVDAYVKLENDIDVSKDVKYRSGFTAPANGRIFEISCKKIYADTKRAVKNLIINGTMTNFIYAYQGNSTITVENIQFLNILVRNCTNAWLYVHYYQFCTFKLINCDFSAFILSNVCNTLLDGYQGLVCVDTSFYFIYNTTTTTKNTKGTTMFYPKSMTNCSIYIDCSGIIGGVYPLYVLSNATNTNISGNIHMYTFTDYTSYNKLQLLRSCSNVLCSVKISYTTPDIATIKYSGDGSGINIIVTDIIDNATIDIGDSSIKMITSDEAKDVISLQKIGFLP